MPVLVHYISSVHVLQPIRELLIQKKGAASCVAYSATRGYDTLLASKDAEARTVGMLCN